MANLFNSVQVQTKGSNRFPLSFSNKFTADLGLLYPTLCKEVLPADVYTIDLTALIRTKPLAAPILSNFYHDTYLFFVPNRLVYEDWSKFIVRGDDGQTDYVKPFMNLKDFAVPQYFYPNTLSDFLNFPSIPSDVHLNQMPDIDIDMMKFNVYNLVYNEFFRDENLNVEIPIWKKQGYNDNLQDWLDAVQELVDNGMSRSDASNLLTPLNLRRRSWRKDYFTSALPFAQKGPQVSVSANNESNQPLPVWFTGSNTTLNVQSLNFLPSATRLRDQYPGLDWPGGAEQDYLNILNSASLGSTEVYPSDILRAWVVPSQLQGITMTLDDLRTGFALQQWYELNARVGSARYTEYLLGHYGVRDRDSRLQRPEYLGSLHGVINVSEVEQNSQTDDNGTPQGTLAGKGLGVNSSRLCSNFFVPEHGFIIAVTSIMPHAVYFQGLGRDWTRFDAFDYYDPYFDHLSEQNIKSQEIYFHWNSPGMSGTDYGSYNSRDFGYTPRFSEYRYWSNELHGDYRGNLNYYVPRRNDLRANGSQISSTITEVDGYNQGLYDTFAFPGTTSNRSCHFDCFFNFNVLSLRPMSKYATPLTLLK